MSRESKYRQIAREMRRTIESGGWQPGSQLPTEEELAAQYLSSRGTVRQALALLAQEGLIRQEQGRGTFVRATAPVRALSLVSFNEAMRRQGREPSTRLIDARPLPAGREVARSLQLPEGTPLLRIERLRLADGQPVAIELRWLAEALAPSFLEQDLERESIHELLVHHYALPLTRMRHTVAITPASSHQAAWLQVQEGSPLFAVERLTYTEPDHPAVLYQAAFRSDQYQFVIEMRLDGEGSP